MPESLTAVILSCLSIGAEARLWHRRVRFAGHPALWLPRDNARELDRRHFILLDY
jgi:hypothetical protein